MALVDCKCGHRYDAIKHEVCPFCGEPNESYDSEKAAAAAADDQAKDDAMQKLAAIILAQEEKIKKGGETITPEHQQIWKTPGIFWSIAAGAALIVFIILLTKLPHAGYLRGGEEDFFISGWLFFGGTIALYLGKLLEGYINNRPFTLKAADGASPSSLGTTNNIGSTLLGGFRWYGMSCVVYDFICFFVPLFPVGCYRAMAGETTQSGKTTSTSYRFYGSEKMNGLEVLQIYLVSWGWLPFIFGAIGIVISWFE